MFRKFMECTFLLGVMLNILNSLRSTSCACIWPSVFQRSTWWDSARGKLVFTDEEVIGFTVVGFANAVISDWICQEETFDQNGLMVLRSREAFVALGTNWFAYACIKMMEITSVSYTYYLLNGQEPNTGQHRLIIHLKTDLTAAETCNEDDGANGAEFVTIIMEGKENFAHIPCPSVLFGKFEIIHTDSVGHDRCGNSNSTEILSVCSDVSKISFDESCLDISPFFSYGDVFCVASISTGNDIFVQLYNNDTTVDNKLTYRFSCMAISMDGVAATIVYKNCTNHQTSTFLPRSHDGTVIGASISFTRRESCLGNNVSIGSPSTRPTNIAVTNSSISQATTGITDNTVSVSVLISEVSSVSSKSPDVHTATTDRMSITAAAEKKTQPISVFKSESDKNMTAIRVGVPVSIAFACVAVVTAITVICYKRRSSPVQKVSKKPKHTGANQNGRSLELTELDDDQQGIFQERLKEKQYDTRQPYKDTKAMNEPVTVSEPNVIQTNLNASYDGQTKQLETELADNNKKTR